MTYSTMEMYGWVQMLHIIVVIGLLQVVMMDLLEILYTKTLNGINPLVSFVKKQPNFIVLSNND